MILRLTVLWVGVAMLVTACGEQSIIQTQPTSTPDPLSFFAPTPISPGQEGNPLVLIYVPPVDAPQVQEAQASTVALLEQASGLDIQIELMDTYADALADLCDNRDGSRFAGAWLNGPSAVLAESAGCGERVLKTTFQGQDSFEGEIVASAPGSLNSLAGRDFCRYEAGNYLSFYSWTLPTLALQTSGLDTTNLNTILDLPSQDLALQSLQDGTCFAVGVPAGVLGEDVPATSTLYTSPPVLVGTLFIPLEMLLGDREALITAYLGIAAEEETTQADEDPAGEPLLARDIGSLQLTDERRALVWLGGGDRVVLAEETDLETMRDFMTRAGFNLERPPF